MKNLKDKIFSKKQSGITAIALVITIIILLVLASITIAVLTGDNGIINRTGDAKYIQEVSDIREELMQKWYALVDETKRDYISNEKMAEELEKKLKMEDAEASASYKEEIEEIWVKYKNHEFEIQASREIAANRETAKREITKAWDKIKDDNSLDDTQKREELADALGEKAKGGVTDDNGTPKVNDYYGYNEIITEDENGDTNIDIELINTDKPAIGDITITATVNDETISDPTNIEVFAGSKLSYTATAQNTTGTPTYQWYTTNSKTTVGGTAIKGATNATYTIDNVKITDSKYYYCEVITKVNGKAETKKSSVLQLTVITRISTAEITPADVTVDLGETIEVEVTAENKNVGEVTYQWYKTDSDEPKDGKSVEGANTSKLEIPDSTTDDGGNYYVVITQTTDDNDTPNIVTSNIVHVTINDTVFNATKENVIVYVGGANDTVTFSGTNIGTLSIETGPDNAKAEATLTGNTLTITPRGAGTTSVTVKEDRGNKTKTINIEVKTTRITTEPDNVTTKVGAGDTEVTLGGESVGTFTIETEPNENVATAEIVNGKLVITPHNSGTTEVTIKEGNGNQTKTITITVEKAKSEVTLTPDHDTITYGEQKEFTAKAESTPAVNGTWTVTSSNTDAIQIVQGNNTTTTNGENATIKYEAVGATDTETTITVTFTPNDTDNYETITKTFTIPVVNKDESEMELTATTATGKTTETVDLSDYVQNPNGTVTYEIIDNGTTGTPSTVTPAGVVTLGELSADNDSDQTVTVRITDSGDGNHEGTSEEFTITVQKYTRTLSWTATTPSSVTYLDTSKYATVTISEGNGTAGTVSYTVTSGMANLSINSATGRLTPNSYTSGATVTATMARTTTVKQATTTKQIAVARATGYVSLDATTGSVPYEIASTTFEVIGTHGGAITVTDNNATATVSPATSEKVPTSEDPLEVTIGNLATIDGGTQIAVTVTSAQTDKFNEASATYTLTIGAAAGKLELTQNSITGNTGVTIDLSELISKSAGTLSYEIKHDEDPTKDNEATKTSTINGSNITLGTLSTENDDDQIVTVIINDAGTVNYEPSSVELTITVQKYTRTLTWTATTPSSIKYLETGKSATVNVTGTGGTAGSVTYASANTGVITIDSTTGALTVVAGSSSSKITATMARTSTVKQASIDTTITTTKNETEKVTLDGAIDGNLSLTKYTLETEDLSTYVQNAKGAVTYEITTNGTSTESTITSAGVITLGQMSTANDNDQTVVVKVTDAGNANYESSFATVTITVQKYTRTIEFTQAVPSTIKYNGTATAAIQLSAGSQTGGTSTELTEATFSTSDSNVIQLSGTNNKTLTAKSASGTALITATLARTATVKTATTTKQITATKADPQVHVAITGENTYGKTLTANATNTGDGSNYTYQWWYSTDVTATSGTNISGATGKDYTIADNNAVGKYIGCTVLVEATELYNQASGSNRAGADASGEGGTQVQKATPAVTVTITGTNTYGQVLTANASNTGDGSNYTYQWWYSDSATATSGTNISGATSKNYTIADSNAVGKYIGCTATVAATNTYKQASGSGILNSSKVAKATPRVTVEITGTNAYGETLTALASNTGNGTSYTYQWWYSDSATATSGTNIGNTTTSNTLTIADATYVGKYIGCTATVAATNSYNSASGSGITDSSANKTTPEVHVTITGENTYGKTLTANATNTGDGTSYTYQWWYSSNADGSNKTNITGATINTYTILDQNAVGKYVGCTATVAATSSYNSASGSGKLGADASGNGGTTIKKATPTVTVLISGTNMYGETLTANASNTGNGSSYTYQWWYSSTSGVSTGTPIGTASTTNSLTINNATYVGKYIGCTATVAATNSYNEATGYKQLTAKTAKATPVVHVTVSGTNKFEELLTATATNTGDGTSYTYQWWYSDSATATSGTNISGANNRTYTITEQNAVGKYIGCTVTVAATTAYNGASGSNRLGADASGNGGTTIGKATPTLTVLISGTNTYGQTLTANASNTGDGTSYTYQWWYNTSSTATTGTLIGTASSTNTLTINNAIYVGKYIGCTATVAETTAYEAASGSGKTGTTVQKATPQVTVTISGTNTYGQKLTATATNTGNGTSYTYQWWYSTSSTATSGTAISGATNKEYTISDSNVVGKYIGCTATVTATSAYTEASGYKEVVTSKVQKATPQVTVSISGTNTYGQTLTANASNTGDGTSYTYQWWYSTSSTATSGTAISGATNKTYTIAEGNAVGKYIGCTATVVETSIYNSASGSGRAGADSSGNGGTQVQKATPQVQVEITGTNAYGETLTAEATNTGDGSNYTYQWWWTATEGATTGTNISGATESTYTVNNGDYVGKYIGCTVTVAATSIYNQATGTGITDSSALKITPQVIVTISGTAKYNETLTANASNTGDGTSYTYQWWYANSSTATSGTNITGATSSTYKITNTNAVGKYIGCTALVAATSAYNQASGSSIVSSSTVAKATPVVTVKVTGTAIYGETLTALASNTGDGTSYTYQWWYSDSATATSGTTISGATSSTYKIANTNCVGKNIGCTAIVAATSAYNSASGSGRLGANDSGTGGTTIGKATPTVTVTISGTNTYGQTLTANASNTGNGTSYTYQWWYANSSTATTGTNITGATSKDYTIADANSVGKYIGCTALVAATATYNQASGSGILGTSKVAKATPQVTVSISGTNTYGQTLTATASNTGNGSNYTYQWWYSTSSTATSGTTISGATNKDYTIADSNAVGKYIGCTATVSATNSYNSANGSGITSTATAKATPVVTVSISGTNTYGQTLTANASNTGDGSSYTYQWWYSTSSSGTSKTNIGSSTTTNTLTINNATYVGKYIGCTAEVSPTTAYNSASGSGITSATAQKATPQVTVSISGTNTFGQKLTANASNTGNGTSYTYQWWYSTSSSATSGTNITGATSKNYTITDSNAVGKYIGCTALVAATTTYNQASGSGRAGANASGEGGTQVQKATPAVTVTIAGTNAYGETLTANATNTGDGSNYTYQWWYSTSSSGTSKTNIGSSTTTNTLTINSATYVGKYIGCTALVAATTAYNSASGSGITNSSANKTTPTVTVTISGTTTYGQKLTATATNTGDGTSYTYQWWYSDSTTATSGTNINGATNKDYTITSADCVGKYVGCTATVAATDAYNQASGSKITTTTVVKATPTVTVSISGTNTYGQTLTANASNTGNGTSYTYQWWYSSTSGVSSGTAITGATSSTYTITNANAVGKYIGCTATVEATNSYNQASGYKELTSKTIKGTPTVTVTISGTKTYGETLTAEASNTGNGTAYSYQWWYSDSSTATSGTTISGANSSSYTILDKNAVGKYVGCTVTVAATTAYNSNSGSSKTSSTISKATPTVTASISGTLTYGETLTVDATNTGDGSNYTYQWWYSTSRTATSGTNISGATSSTYTILNTNCIGKYIGCKVTVAETDAYKTANSSAIANSATVIKGTPQVTVTITGTLTYNETLTATATNTGNGTSYTYQWWYSSSNTATSGTTISGATSSTYTITNANAVGKYIGCTVTVAATTAYNSNSGYKEAITSKVQKATPQVTVTISGTNTFGQKLTANASNTGNGTSYTYQWWYSTSSTATSGTAISGATSKDYTIADSNAVGKYIGCTVIVATTTAYNEASGSGITSSKTVKATPEVNVTISGTNSYGATLTATASNTGNGTSYTYQWWYTTSSTATSGTNISGATSSTYTINNTTYVGKYIGCTATVAATSAYNQASGSGKTGATSEKGTPTVTVSISGTNAYGQTLTANATNTGNGTSYTYQWWYSSSSTATSGTAISGATSNTYTIDNTNCIGKYVGCTATVASTTAYNSASGSGKTSSTATKGTPTVNVSISGTAKYNETLTATASNTGNGTSYTYQWWYSTSSTATSGTTINGATSSTYTITNASCVGKYVGCTATVAATTAYNSNSGSGKTASTVGKADNPITVTNPAIQYTGATLDLSSCVSNAQGTVSYTIKTDGTSGSTISGSNITLGELSTANDNNQTVVVTATAAGNTNYANTPTKDITITVQKHTRTLAWDAETPSSIEYQEHGKYAKANVSQVDGVTINLDTVIENAGDEGVITYTSGTPSKITIDSETGELTAVAASGSSTITATMARTSTVKQTSITKSISTAKATVKKPENLNVSTAGFVTWDPSDNATGYQISINGSTWTDAESGINYLSTITGSTGTRTVRVKGINSNTTNYQSTTNSIETYDVNVYTVTIKRNNTSYGTLSLSSYKVIEGVEFETNGNDLNFIGEKQELVGENFETVPVQLQTVTVTPSANCELINWSLTSGTISANTTITANLDYKVYQIVLDSMGADTPGTEEIYEKYNTGYYLDSDCTLNMTTSENPITIPVKNGYVFKGYYTQETGGSQYISDTGYATSSATATSGKQFFKDDGTLYARWKAITLKSNSSGSATEAFLGTTITRDKIKKISFATSIAGHTVDNTTCWDVSYPANCGGVLLWIASGDDTNGYEIVIGQNGGVIANPTSAYLFSYIGNSIPAEIDLTNLNTELVTSMGAMFMNCKNVTTLDVSSFNTAAVTNMYMMFYSCSSLTSLDLSNFNTSSVPDMGFMFAGCSSLTSLDVSNFNTAAVTNMSSMFSSCSGLTSLDVSNFNTAAVTNMYMMFYSCSSLTSLDLSNFNTAAVTNMSSMFSSCSGLTSLDVSNFNTAAVTNMSSMFSSCSGLTSLDVSNFNTAAVTKMGSMFSSCRGLTSLDVSNFNTAAVTNMNSMFSSCSGLTSLDIRNFNTANVTNMINMFFNCSSLTSLNVSIFNTAKVTSMGAMFENCSSLTGLDLSSFNTASVTGMSRMFYSCSSLTSLDLSSFNTASVTNMGSMFEECSGLTSLDVSNFNTAVVTNMGSMFSSCSGLTTIYASNNFVTTAVTSGNNMFSYCTTKLKGGAGTVWSSSKTSYTYAHIDGGTANPGYFTNKNTVNLETGPNFNNHIPSTATSVVFTAIPVPTGVTTTDVSAEQNNSIVSWMDGTTMYVASTDAGARIKANASCSNMFKNKTSLTSIDFSNFDTSVVKNMSSMFYGCSGLTSLDLNSFNTTAVTSMSSVFNNCSSLTSLNVSSFNTAKVTSMSSMFYNCSSLTSLNVSSFNTAKLTSMNYMFENCSSLTSLNVSSFNTAEVTSMSSVFYNCSSLTSLDLSSFNTSSVTSMSSMFFGCSGLTSLDIRNFNTANVTSMSNMFYNCSSLTSLNVSSFNTESVTSMHWMFTGCSSLTSLDLSIFNTAKVTDMSNMFDGCSGLTSLDLSSFNTSLVTNMFGMVRFCSNLTTIYAAQNQFNTTSVTSGNSMFSNCSNKLKGGAGTTWSASHVNYDYAHIDGGTGNPGYFTAPGQKRDISTATVTLNPSSYTYDGTAKTPTPTVTWGGSTLVQGTDYTVSYQNNINVGTASSTNGPKAIITGKGLYGNSTDKGFDITQATVTIPSQSGTLTYTGSSQSPSWNNYNSNIMTLGGTTSGINAGSYNATFTLKSTTNCKWSDNTTAAKTVAWSIGKKANPIAVTASQTWSATFKTSAQTKSITAATGAQGTVTYAIQSQKNSSNSTVSHFTISGTTLTMAANTPVSGSQYTVVIRATAAGNTNYSSGYKDITMKVTVGKAANPISVTATQTISVTYSTSNQDKSFTAATGAQGTLTYSIKSQKNKSGTAVTKFSIPTASTATLRVAGSTPVSGSTYTVVITATAAGNANYNSGSKEITVTVTVSKASAAISLSATSGTIIAGNSTTFTITYSGDCTLAVSPTTQSSSTKAIASLSSKTVTVTGISAGEQTITVSASGGSNYAVPTSKTYTATIQTALYEVSVVASGKLKYHRTLANAVAATGTNATIKVLANTTESDQVTISKTMTINTNGKTLTRSGAVSTSRIVVSGGTVTFSGTGTAYCSVESTLIKVTGGTFQNSGAVTFKSVGNCIDVHNNSTVKLNGCTLNSTTFGNSWSSTVCMQTGAWNVTITSCNIYANQKGDMAVVVNAGSGTLLINGSSVISNGTATSNASANEPTIWLAPDNTATTTIEGTTSITSGTYGGHAVSVRKGTLKVKAGTLTANAAYGYGVMNFGGNVQISGGTVTGAYNNYGAALVQNGSTATATVSGGTLKGNSAIYIVQGTTTVSGGTLTGTSADGISMNRSEAASSTLNISGGTIKGDNWSVYVSYGTLNRSGSPNYIAGSSGRIYYKGNIY